MTGRQTDISDIMEPSTGWDTKRKRNKNSDENLRWFPI